MAERTLNPRIQLRNGTAAQWTSKNPKLLKGEIGIEIDTKKFKIGDGTKLWSDLDYANITDLSNYYTKAELDQAMALINAGLESLEQHGVRRDNPHGVTANQVGAYTKAEVTELVSQVNSNINDATADLGKHKANTSNPHGVTASQVGAYSKSEADNLLANKVDKVTGKGLSKNDYDDTEKANVLANTNARHIHGNKDLLDTYDQTNANIKDAISKKHNHNNKTILDNTTASYTTEDKTKLGNIEAGANVNVLEGVQLNGTDLTITNKKVNIETLDTIDTNSSKPIRSSAVKTYVGEVKEEIEEDFTITIDNHKNDKGNPHGVTKSQVGLGNVTNDAQVKRSEMGVANGVATLDNTGKVPTAQLPSFVDDVLEYANKSSFPTTGEAGKIYVSQNDNKTYRWSGSTYVEISSSLALGETSSTAYRGDRGKTAYNHSQLTSGNPHKVTKSDVGLGNVDNTSDANKPISNATQQALNQVNIYIENVENKVDANEGDIAELNTALGTLKGRVDSTENQLGALEETVSNIKANVYVIDLGQIDAAEDDSFTLHISQEDGTALTDYGIENVVVKVRDIDKDEIIYGKLGYVDSDNVPVYIGKDSSGVEYSFTINKTQLACELVLYKTLIFDCGGA